MPKYKTPEEIIVCCTKCDELMQFTGIKKGLGGMAEHWNCYKCGNQVYVPVDVVS